MEYPYPVIYVQIDHTETTDQLVDVLETLGLEDWRTHNVVLGKNIFNYQKYIAVCMEKNSFIFSSSCYDHTPIHQEDFIQKYKGRVAGIKFGF